MLELFNDVYMCIYLSINQFKIKVSSVEGASQKRYKNAIPQFLQFHNFVIFVNCNR